MMTPRQVRWSVVGVLAVSIAVEVICRIVLGDYPMRSFMILGFGCVICLILLRDGAL
jgi:hypothetical protein